MAEISRKALILPGAGARGAYQVGVLKAISRMLPKKAPNPFAVISGTSAGAINAAVIASRAGRFSSAIKEMERVWANFTVDQVYRADSWTMLRSSLQCFFASLGLQNPRALLDNTPLRELLARDIKFERIQRAIERGHLEVLTITASAYSSAQSVSFFQGHKGLKSWARVRRCGRPAVIGLNHLMASAAVPFIFPAVKIGAEYYGDGAMRQSAPLSSAIHLGADRMLIIGVDDERPDPEPNADAPPETPSFAHLAGYMLDTLFMDGLYADLERLNRINRIMEQIPDHVSEERNSELRPLNTLIIAPKKDIRSVAERHLHELPRAIRLLLRGVGATNRSGIQLTSYLLFESGFTTELIEMGFQDAISMESDIKAFFCDGPIRVKESHDGRF